MNSHSSRNRKAPDLRSPDDREDWERIRERIRKNRTDPALHQWATQGADLEECPSLWLVDNTYLIGELGRIRELVQRVPLASVAMSLPLQTVSDAIYRLERQLREILSIHRDGQRAFAKQAAIAEQKASKATKKALPKIVRLRASA